MTLTLEKNPCNAHPLHAKTRRYTQIITIEIYQVYPEEYAGLLREIDGAALAPHAVGEDAWHGG